MSNNINGVTPPAPRPAPQVSAPAVAAAAPAKEGAGQAAPVQAKVPMPSMAEQRARAEASREELKRAVERMNQQAVKDGRKLNFAMDEVTDQMVITVRKAETGEVIRQIPSEAALRVAHNMEELKGLLHNQTS